MFSSTLEICRLSVLFTFNYCVGNDILMYLEQPLTLIQQSILCYIVLTRKNQLTFRAVLILLFLCFNIAMFMIEIFPLIVLEYIVVSEFAIHLGTMCHTILTSFFLN